MKRDEGLMEVSLDELQSVAGGSQACEIAGLPPLNRRQGLQVADYVYQHAKANGMSARQFNRIGWREYARQHCVDGGVGRRTPYQGGGYQRRGIESGAPID